MSVMKEQYGEWNPWIPSRMGQVRTVDKEYPPEFGQVFYNSDTNIIFIRRVSHEFEDVLFQALERKAFLNCEYLGEL